MEKLFSIIIPCYNAEKFIKRCLDSILSQTYKNYEVIVVNDGSTDDTIKVIKKESELLNVKVISIENQGVSNARNVGVEQAKGDYVIFVDADDVIREDMLELFNKAIVSDDEVEMVISGFDRKKENLESYADTLLPECIVENKDNTLLIRELVSGGIFCSVWRHCFSRRFLIENNFIFDKSYEIAEDLLYLYYLYKKIKKYKTVNECLYSAVDTTGSASRGVYKVKHLDRLKVENIVEKDLKIEYPQFLPEMGGRLVYSYTRCLINLSKSKDKRLKAAVKPVKRDLRRVLKEYKKIMAKRFKTCAIMYGYTPNFLHRLVLRIELLIRGKGKC